MIKCPNCGFFALDETQACPRCKADLRVRKLDLAAPGSRPGFKELPSKALRPFLLAWWRVQGFFDQPPDESLPYRHPVMAAWLSAVPGAGQVYNGQPRVGALHLATFAGFVLSGAWMIESWVSDFLFLGGLFVILFSMNHALMEAQTVNGAANFLGAARWRGFFLFMALSAVGMWAIQFFALAWIAAGFLLFGLALALGTIEGRHRRGQGFGLAAPLCVLLVACGVAFMFRVAPLWAWRSVIRLQSHGQEAYAPFIQRSDRLLIEGISTAWRPIQLGDIVFYDPDRYKAIRVTSDGEDWSLVNMSTNIERVVGLPGDTFEKRGSEYLLNGRPAPEIPICRAELPASFRVEAPPGCYIVVSGYGPIEWMPAAGVRKAMPPPPNELERISVVPADQIFGRVLMIYRPWSRRRWIAG